MAGNFQVDGSGSYASLKAAVDACSGGENITSSSSWDADDQNDVTWDVAVTVRISGSARNTVGKPGRANGSYRLVGDGAGHLFVTTADVDIWDMDMESASSGASDEIFNIGDNELDVTCKRCYIGFDGNTTEQDAIYYAGTAVATIAYTFESCMFHDVGRSIIDFYDIYTTTATVNFNGCSALNIGANGGRDSGAWVGGSSADELGSLTVNVFNCLIEYDTSQNAAFISPVLQTETLNVDYCISKGDNGTGGAAGDLCGTFSTVNQTNGNSYSVTWTEGDPGAGEVGMIETGTSPYDQRLFDDATHNIAQDNHSVETGPDSGLAIANDIVGTVRGASEDHDVGAFEIADASPSAGLSYYFDTEGTAELHFTVTNTTHIAYDAGSILYWFNIQTIGDGDAIFGVGDATDYIQATMDAAGNIDVTYMSQSTAETITGDIACGTGEWHCLKITFDDSGGDVKVHSYIDGVENGTAQTIANAFVPNASDVLYLGADYAGSNIADIFIDEFHWTNKAGTPENWTAFGTPLHQPLLEIT